ncbi:MAG: thioredoxin family protein [Bacteroidales bacterium]
MLQTNLKHILSENDYYQVIENNENVMICCGRMGPMCIPVYATMKDLEPSYGHVVFYDMEFDHPASSIVRNLPECRGFMGLPFTVYYKNGKVAKATSGIQNKAQITEILDNHLK